MNTFTTSISRDTTQNAKNLVPNPWLSFVLHIRDIHRMLQKLMASIPIHFHCAEKCNESEWWLNLSLNCFSQYPEKQWGKIGVNQDLTSSFPSHKYLTILEMRRKMCFLLYRHHLPSAHCLISFWSEKENNSKFTKWPNVYWIDLLLRWAVFCLWEGEW